MLPLEPNLLRGGIMRYIIIVFLVLVATLAFAQGEPHSLYGTIQNLDSTIPSADCINFCAYFGIESLCFPEDSGIGQVRYLEGYGVWLIHMEIFDPAPGDGDEVDILFWNTCNDEGASIVVTIDTLGSSQDIGEIMLGVMGVDEGRIPGEISIRAYPNPFNAECRIEGASSVEIVDITGKILRNIDGEGSLMWDGRDDYGRDLPSGIYFISDRKTGRYSRVLMLR